MVTGEVTRALIPAIFRLVDTRCLEWNGHARCRLSVAMPNSPRKEPRALFARPEAGTTPPDDEGGIFNGAERRAAVPDPRRPVAARRYVSLRHRA